MRPSRSSAIRRSPRWGASWAPYLVRAAIIGAGLFAAGARGRELFTYTLGATTAVETGVLVWAWWQHRPRACPVPPQPHRSPHVKTPFDLPTPSRPHLEHHPRGPKKRKKTRKEREREACAARRAAKLHKSLP